MKEKKQTLFLYTFDLGEEVTAEIILKPLYQKSQMEEYFIIPDDSLHWRLISNGTFKVHYDYLPKTRGMFMVAGTILEYVDSNDTTDLNKEVIVKSTSFHKKYIVK